MSTGRTRGRLLAATWLFAGLLMAIPATAQETEGVPPPVPWQRIEAWAMSAPEASPAVKDQPKDVVKDVVKEPVKEAPVDVVKDVPKDTPKETVVSSSTWAPTRPGERRPDPPAYKAMYEQVLLSMGQRLKDIQNTNYRRQAEVYLALEQHDKAFQLLSQMCSEPKRWKEDVASGWLNGNLWECALFCRTKPPAQWIQQQFDEWKAKEPARIEAYALREGSSYREKLMKAFQDKQEYFTKDGATIAEKIKDLELKGDTTPVALVELKDRCANRRPGAPLTCLRAYYKLRDWYPDLPDVKNGEIPMALILHLAGALGMYREASREAESLMEKAPTCGEVARGSTLYYAAEYAYQHAERLAPDQSDGWMLSDRTRPVYKDAKESWERARLLFTRMKKEYPKHWANQPSTTTGRSDVEHRLSYIARPERLGLPK